MNPQVSTFARRALFLLPVWTALLFLGTLTHQPDPQTAFADFAAYITTDVFLVSHLVASIGGAALGSIGIAALLLHLQASAAARRLAAGLAATIAGNTLMTAVFGVAAFAQPAMGRLFQARDESAVTFYNETYGVPLMVTAMLGMLLFLIGGVATGSAVAASGRFPRWTGWLYALGSAGFVLSFILWPLGMSVFSALLTSATAFMAWHAGRKGEQPAASAVLSAQA
jgi:hypothetical protein